MSNIVSLSGRKIPSVLRITPAQMFHHVRALWVCGAINQDAYVLGNAILAYMQADNDAPTVALRYEELVGVYTSTPTGQVLSGAFQGGRGPFNIAMQDLHFHVGIISAKNPDEFDEKDAALRHFTRSPVTARSEWAEDTPIYFRLPSGTNEQYAARVTDIFRERMSKFHGQVTIVL